jgi:hypothetical protein
MKVDIQKMTLTVNQIISMANLGAAVVQAGAGVVQSVLGVLRQRGYEVDTESLDELIADAERRRLLAAREKLADK